MKALKIHNLTRSLGSRALTLTYRLFLTFVEVAYQY